MGRKPSVHQTVAQEKQAAYMRAYYHRTDQGTAAAIRRRKRRAAVLAYLGSECVICGFDDARALQVDHVLGNGAEERKSMGQDSIFAKVLSGDHDDEYQLLCANCNWIKRVEMGEVN